jgi:hypothetical protein
LPIADCRLPIALSIANCGLTTGLPIVNSIVNRQSLIELTIPNPIDDRQSPIVNSIGNLQSAVGNRQSAIIPNMQPLQIFASTVLAGIIRRQPASKERTAFAWTVAVGPALAKVTSVELRGDVLVVVAQDSRWAREVERASPIVLERLQSLLGADVRRIRVVKVNTATDPPRRSQEH